jgi:hypothetical protein
VLLVAFLTSLAVLGTGVQAAQAWRLTIEIYGAGYVEETQNPESTRQKCGSLNSTTATGTRQTTCVSNDIYCGLCNYTIKATPAAGFTFTRFEWVRPTDIPSNGNQSSWTWAAGNAGDFTVRAYFSDSSPPDTTLTGGPGQNSFVKTVPAFNFTTTQAFGVGTYVCTLNGGAIGCSTPFSLPAQPDGLKTFTVAARDPSGNTDPSPESRTFTIDTIAPVVTLSGGPPQGSRTNARTATVGIAVADVNPDFRTCMLDGQPLGCDGGTISLQSLGDGAHMLSATATDKAGNTGQTVTRSWTVDTDPPSTTLSGGPANGSISASSVATFALDSDEAGTFTCTLDGAPLACGRGELTIPGLKDGEHTLSVHATDVAGNASQVPATRTWRVLATPPETTITDGPSGETTETQAVLAFSGAGTGGRYECRLDGGPFGPCSQAAGHVLTGLAPGIHTFEVRAIDGAGNVDASPAGRTWTVVTKPVVIGDPAGPAGDADGDGIVDPSDRCPAVAAGSFDQDHDGCPGPFARISITATVVWASASRKGIKVTAFYVADAPKGATVEVLCVGKRKCPYAQKLTATGKRLRLAKFAGKTLKPGTAIAIRVTLAGMTGDYVVKTVNRVGAGRKGLVRFGRQPLTTTRQCVPQGLTTPAKVCA